MAKITDYSLALLPQEVADLLDDLKTNWNFGKYQMPVVSTLPDWQGREGETAIYAAANTWALMICSSDNTTTWVPISQFQWTGSYPGVQQTPVVTSYPGVGRIGETAIYATANTWALMTCVSDETATWVSVSNFEPTVAFSGRTATKVVDAYPAYAGRLGENVYYSAGNTWALITCVSDNTTNWSPINTFFPAPVDYGTKFITSNTSFPTRTGRLGETMLYSSANTWSLLACTSDQTNRWSTVSNFFPATADGGKFQFRFMTSATSTNGYVGEIVCFTAANTWALMMCTSDQTANWRHVANFLS